MRYLFITVLCLLSFRSVAAECPSAFGGSSTVRSLVDRFWGRTTPKLGRHSRPKDLTLGNIASLNLLPGVPAGGQRQSESYSWDVSAVGDLVQAIHSIDAEVVQVEGAAALAGPGGIQEMLGVQGYIPVGTRALIDMSPVEEADSLGFEDPEFSIAISDGLQLTFDANMLPRSLEASQISSRQATIISEIVGHAARAEARVLTLAIKQDAIDRVFFSLRQLGKDLGASQKQLTKLEALERYYEQRFQTAAALEIWESHLLGAVETDAELSPLAQGIAVALRAQLGQVVVRSLSDLLAVIESYSAPRALKDRLAKIVEGVWRSNRDVAFRDYFEVELTVLGGMRLSLSGSVHGHAYLSPRSEESIVYDTAIGDVERSHPFEFTPFRVQVTPTNTQVTEPQVDMLIQRLGST